MNINWAVRAKNPLFWIQMACAVGLPMLAGVGLEWEDVTSWPVLFDTIVKAVANPVVLLAMLGAAWGVVNDPTTAGASDSQQAMSYKEPMVDASAKHAKGA